MTDAKYGSSPGQVIPNEELKLISAASDLFIGDGVVAGFCHQRYAYIVTRRGKIYRMDYDPVMGEVFMEIFRVPLE